MRDNGYGELHDGHRFQGLHWLVPLVLFLLIVGGIAWVIARGSFRRPPHLSHDFAHLSPPFFPPPYAADPALAAARLRYARGELSRDDYARIAADLGMPLPDAAAGSPPPASAA